MELMTISKVSKSFGISTRTLRYYEQIGLIQSDKLDDYMYRVYSPETVTRLNQIIILRKLRIPLKNIADILKNDDAKMALAVFQNNIEEIDDEVTALSTIKSILNTFVDKINESLNASIKIDILSDDTLTEIVDTLEITKMKLKEEKTATDLQVASEKLNKLTDRDVRIIYLPPMTVASIHIIGESPEFRTGNLLHEFIKDKNLDTIKPDLRHFGFNHPNGTDDNSNDHGYERWVSIPDDLSVEAPFTKERFKGGIYAAHMIPMGAFEEWGWLWEWAHNNSKYDADIIDDSGECMSGLLEEHLNFINNYNLSNEKLDEIMQLDLLIPIKEKGE